jgi:hypothetical protein
LVVAAFRAHCLQERRDLFLHDDVADKGRRRDALDIHRQRVALMPSGVALTTKS